MYIFRFRVIKGDSTKNLPPSLPPFQNKNSMDAFALAQGAGADHGWVTADGGGAVQVRVGRPPGSARPLVSLSPAVEARAGPQGWEVSLFEALPAAASSAVSPTSSSAARAASIPGTGEDSGELMSGGDGSNGLSLATSHKGKNTLASSGSFASAQQQQQQQHQWQGPKAFARVEDMWSGGGKGAEGDFAAASALRTPRASVDGVEGTPNRDAFASVAASSASASAASASASLTAAAALLMSSNGNVCACSSSSDGAPTEEGEGAGGGGKRRQRASDGMGHTFLMNAPSLAALAFRVDVTDRDTGALLARGFAPADALKGLEGELVVPLLSPCCSPSPPPSASAFNNGGGAVISPEPAGEFRASFLVITALPHPSNSLAGLQRAKWNASLDSAASSSAASASSANSSLAEGGRTLDIGHRGVGATAGARARVAENTLLSFQAAAAVHSDFVEFDVHVTADGEVVVHHDFAVVLALGGSGKPQSAFSAAAAAAVSGGANSNGGGVIAGASPPRTLPGPAPTDAAVRLGIPCLTLAQLRSSAIAAAMRSAAQHAAVSGKGKHKNGDDSNGGGGAAAGAAFAVEAAASGGGAPTSTPPGGSSNSPAATEDLEGHGQNQHRHDDEAAATAAALVSHAANLGRTLKRTLSSGEDILRTHAPPPMISSPDRRPVSRADAADAFSAAAAALEVSAVVGSPLQDVPEESGGGGSGGGRGAPIPPRRAPPRAPSAGSSAAGTPSSLLTASLLAASAAASSSSLSSSSATASAAAAAAATTAAAAAAKKPPSAAAAPPPSNSSSTKTAWRISDRIATLRECFRASPPWLGFNVEIKYPAAADAAALRGVRFLSRNEHCDAVLRVVLEEARGRKVIFSTFDPDCATLLSLKQPRFPVFFLTNAGTEAFEDPRMSSLAAAVEFAAGSNLQGVVAEASAVLPRLARTVAAAHARGLRLFTWGAANNDPRAYAAQKEAGVDAIISDDVATHARAAGKKSSHTRVEAEAEAAAEARAAEERARAKAEAAAARAARVAAKGGSPPGGISAAFAALTTTTGEEEKQG